MSPPPKWTTDRDYFTRIDTAEKAYILGLILADGHVTNDGRKIQISLKENDAELLRAVARELNHDAPLTPQKDGMMRLTLYSVKMVRDLNKLGLHHDKSYSATLPSVAPELERHLLRGLWDGDGSIDKRMIGLIGTPSVLESTAAIIERHTGCVLRRRMAGKDKKYHYLLGSKRDAPAVRWMYDDVTLVLARKAEAASSDYWR